MTILTTARPAVSYTTPSMLTAILRMFALRRQRGALSRMDADQLRDIGVSRTEAQAEALRPMWDVPTNWLR